MNQIKTLLILLITVGYFSLATAQSKKSSDLTFQSEEFNFGKIDQNSKGETVFVFTNTGDAPLIISKVKTSCGCTVPSYSEKAIMPGESGEIFIKYDTKKVGAFSKTITVFSNSNKPAKILKIKGEVIKNSI